MSTATQDLAAAISHSCDLCVDVVAESLCIFNSIPHSLTWSQQSSVLSGCTAATQCPLMSGQVGGVSSVKAICSNWEPESSVLCPLSLLLQPLLNVNWQPRRGRSTAAPAVYDTDSPVSAGVLRTKATHVKTPMVFSKKIILGLILRTHTPRYMC